MDPVIVSTALELEMTLGGQTASPGASDSSHELFDDPIQSVHTK
jgi:hypothetical protein